MFVVVFASDAVPEIAICRLYPLGFKFKLSTTNDNSPASLTSKLLHSFVGFPPLPSMLDVAANTDSFAMVLGILTPVSPYTR